MSPRYIEYIGLGAEPPLSEAFELLGQRRNSIMIISPYRCYGTWVFDDPSVGLVREPFVAGIPEIIDRLVANIPNADKGFRLYFSGKPFPGYLDRLKWLREEFGGNWYLILSVPAIEGWLCPALFKYFESAPKEIYVKVAPI